MSEEKKDHPFIEAVRPHVDHLPDYTPPPTPQKRQYELSAQQLKILAEGHYSAKAMEVVARLKGFDPATIEWLDGENSRTFLAVPKKWVPLPPERGINHVTTTQNIGAGVEIIKAAELRSVMSKRDLTKTVSDETHEEEV